MVTKTYRNDGMEGRPTTIAAGATWIIDPANTSGGGKQDYMAKYQPFNSVFIRNNDAMEIQIDLNGSPQRRISLPQGATVTVMNESFFNLYIKNVGISDIVSGSLTVRLEKLEGQK